MSADVKGHVMLGLKKLVEEKIGKEGLKNIEKEYGSLDFQANKIYSEEKAIQFLRTIAKVVTGEDDSKGLFEAGKLMGQSMIQNPLGKATATFAGKYLVKSLALSSFQCKMVEKTVKVICPNLGIEVENIDERTVKVIYSDTKMPPEVFQGEVEEGLRLLRGEAFSTYNRLNSTAFEVIVSLDDKF